MLIVLTYTYSYTISLLLIPYPVTSCHNNYEFIINIWLITITISSQ